MCLDLRASGLWLRDQILPSGNLGARIVPPSSFLRDLANYGWTSHRPVFSRRTMNPRSPRSLLSSVWINMSSLSGEKGGYMTSSLPFFQRPLTRAGEKALERGCTPKSITRLGYFYQWKGLCEGYTSLNEHSYGTNLKKIVSFTELRPSCGICILVVL